jgi:hypothetical protein
MKVARGIERIIVNNIELLKMQIDSWANEKTNDPDNYTPTQIANIDAARQLILADTNIGLRSFAETSQTINYGVILLGFLVHNAFHNAYMRTLCHNEHAGPTETQFKQILVDIFALENIDL